MATFEETLQEISAAAHAAGLLSGSGHVDMGQAESALVHALRRLSQTIDIDGFKVIGDPLFMTVADVHTYPMPSDFGRLTRPDDEGDSGIYVYDEGGSPANLQYMDPNEMLRSRNSGASRPSFFCMTSSNRIRLHPTPDGEYSVAGVYIHLISAERLMGADGDTSLPEHTFLRDSVLAQMALELGHPRAVQLMQLAEDSRTKLVNEHLRIAQAFQYKHADRFTRNRLVRGGG